MTRRLAELDRLDQAVPAPLPIPSRHLRRRRRRDRAGRRSLAVLVVPIGLLLVGTLAVGTRHLPLSVLRVTQLAGDTPPIPADAQRDPLGTPPPAPAGDGGFRFLAHLPGQPDAPVTYDPCRPIHVVVNKASAPPGADRLLREAIHEVSRATGLVFIIEGPTDEAPSQDRPAHDDRYGDRWSPVLVEWTTPARVPALRGRIAGVGGSTPRKGPTSGPRYVTGTVSLDGPTMRRIVTRPDGHRQARAIVMHELGHLVGLDHVPDPSQLMYEDNVGQVAFGDGDLRGLHELGLGKCYLDT
jgi:hypothetical protein